MTCSMRRKGNCWDNAPMEIWFNSFKNERVLGIRYATHDDMKAASFEYIEVFYNQKRQHPTLGTVAHAIPGAVNQRATSGKTGSMKSTLWQTKNRGNLRSVRYTNSPTDGMARFVDVVIDGLDLSNLTSQYARCQISQSNWPPSTSAAFVRNPPADVRCPCSSITAQNSVHGINPFIFARNSAFRVAVRVSRIRSRHQCHLLQHSRPCMKTSRPNRVNNEIVHSNRQLFSIFLTE